MGQKRGGDRLVATILSNLNRLKKFTLLLATLQNIHRFKKNSLTLSHKRFLIWLLTTPSYLKYVHVATLPCNLSLMACFADINVSRGSAVAYARCVWEV